MHTVRDLRVSPVHLRDTAGLSVRVRSGIHTFSPAVGRLEPIRDRLRSFQSEPHPAPLRPKSETQNFTTLTVRLRESGTKNGRTDDKRARKFPCTAHQQRRFIGLASDLHVHATPMQIRCKYDASPIMRACIPGISLHAPCIGAAHTCKPEK